ncbi:sensor domain-containing phosphodiesterase [Cereibacter changlensis JA139]|uniref:Sensor domain-containing phosphodiesterase n=2 Tax=Cereibacter changlensis TaxID=402884 RepID=A0A2T4JUE8_9RHOB|nr:sensor domain-containing phosphodiesterase [Cereibacter changlensis JA139]PZX55192.1 EAL domain-containing protein (putative c-di-GMP-specific phosphodiesterase class I) [Cereibacter changlensis]
MQICQAVAEQDFVIEQTEDARLEALQQLRLLDTSASESFDRITRMASQIFGLPVAAVSLTDQDRQWFKSRVGVEHMSIPRHKAPCAQVAETTMPVVINDLLADPFYADSTLGRNGTRFYAGAPLVTREGFGLGALCVLGTEPRQASPAELSALVDLAAMVMAQIELQHAFGRLDPVSGLPSRNQFRDDLADLARDGQGEPRFAVVVDFARPDQISQISRVMGGARFDDLIREATRSLRRILGPQQALYYVGLAQFAFLSPPEAAAETYIEELQALLDQLRAAPTVGFVTDISLGARPFLVGEEAADDLLRGSASAAQDARSASAGVMLYSACSDRVHRRQYALLQDFAAALVAQDQLRLVYHPRIDLATGRCVGAEALLRWNHPVFGEISPAEFIPIVEQTSLARALTQWVLGAALDQLAAWQGGGVALTLSLNISASNLAEADLAQRIRLALQGRGLPADRLELELTESAIMNRPEQALAVLQDLAGIGLTLAIDDFGTGHSSLAYLQRLPARVMKIDQTFVRSLSGAVAGSDLVLVETMIGLAQRLGYRVVAEGVETAEVADLLARLGCEEAQGYWFSRPLEAAAFADWLADRAINAPAP